MVNKNTEIRHTRTDKPNQPVPSFLQEADNLYTWSLTDSKELSSVGISTEMIEELPLRANACRTTQAIWISKWNSPSKVQKQWKLLLPKAIEFRAEILHTMRFALRKDPDLLRIVSTLSKGNTNADLIQDLNDIAVFGKKHTVLLNKIGFAISLLDVAATKSEELAELWAKVNAEKGKQSEFKQNRNRTFWHLHELVTEIREAGRYVFRNDKSRYNGYTSTFWKNKYKKRSKPGKP